MPVATVGRVSGLGEWGREEGRVDLREGMLEKRSRKRMMRATMLVTEPVSTAVRIRRLSGSRVGCEDTEGRGCLDTVTCVSTRMITNTPLREIGDAPAHAQELSDETERDGDVRRRRARQPDPAARIQNVKGTKKGDAA